MSGVWKGICMKKDNNDIDLTKVIKFHDAVCESSHSDKCGWMYEIKNGTHRWVLPSHYHWLTKYKEAKKNNFDGYFIKVPYKESL
jgi:hypothetical protein